MGIIAPIVESLKTVWKVVRGTFSFPVLGNESVNERLSKVEKKQNEQEQKDTAPVPIADSSDAPAPVEVATVPKVSPSKPTRSVAIPMVTPRVQFGAPVEAFSSGEYIQLYPCKADGTQLLKDAIYVLCKTDASVLTAAWTTDDVLCYATLVAPLIIDNKTIVGVLVGASGGAIADGTADYQVPVWNNTSKVWVPGWVRGHS